MFLGKYAVVSGLPRTTILIAFVPPAGVNVVILMIAAKIATIGQTRSDRVDEYLANGFYDEGLFAVVLQRFS